MENIQHLPVITEARAIDAIFDACRANETREPKKGVTFRLLVNGMHEAALRDADGVVIAIAHVDRFDV
jgi:inactivated superfamily I helicase